VWLGGAERAPGYVLGDDDAMKYTLYEDGEWELTHDDRYGLLKYWLDHSCSVPGKECHRYYTTIDVPCHECGSECPAGLKGMYMTLVML
jgi:hypothetical protein